MEADHDRVSVLYLGGIGRSGSTVLGRVLAKVPGVRSLGEVVHVWARGLRDNDLCGCGVHFRHCPFWSEVGIVAFGGWEKLDLYRTLALQSSVDRNRYLPWLISGLGPGSFGAAREEYSALLSNLYLAARTVSGAEVIVDTSKNAPYAWLLRGVPGVDLRVLHLVRDSRGVAHSWAGRARRPEITGRVAYMDSLAPSQAAVRWMVANSLFDALALTTTQVMRMRYEDFVEDPVGQLRRIAGLGGFALDAQTRRQLEADTLTLPQEHEVSGNPLRFSASPVTLRRDDRWRREMTARDRHVVTALSGAGLLRHGYPLRTSR